MLNESPRGVSPLLKLSPIVNSFNFVSELNELSKGSLKLNDNFSKVFILFNNLLEGGYLQRYNKDVAIFSLSLKELFD
jgi:hypothetical protein